MTWFKVDDGLHSHPKSRRAGLAAMGMWVLAGSFSARYTTDGFISEDWVAEYPVGRRRAAELVRAGFWIPGEKDGEQGWFFHDWPEFQPSKAEIVAERAANRLRQKAWRARQQAGATSTDQPNSNGVTNGVTNPVTNGAPSLPFPSLSTKDLSSADARDVFDEFWTLYPRKEAKGAAAKAFKTASKKIDPNSIVLGLKVQVPALLARDRQFVPLPASWLNAERWADEVAPSKPERTEGWWNNQ